MKIKVLTTASILLSIVPFFLLNAQWQLTNSMHVSRSYHTATLLPSGNVLIAGGLNNIGSLNSCEIYNTILNDWTVAPPMYYRRFGHSAALLLNGKVLVTGGYDYQASTYLNSCELYDPIVNSWSMTDSMRTKRSGHTATLLDDGRVLVVGGEYSRSCEIYDPLISKWFDVDSTHSPRMGHSATKLEGGKVIIIGSWGAEWDYDYYLETCELFNLQTFSWSFTDSMIYARAFHSTAVLSDDRLFVSGGKNSEHVSQCEVYDPVDNVWSVSDSLRQPRSDHCSVTLLNGEVLIIGGQYGTDPQSNYHALSSCELRNVNGIIVHADSLKIARYGHQATLLQDGNILLVTGGAEGLHFNRIYLNSCELYSMNTNGIHEQRSNINALSFQLRQNYPNPFNPTTKIEFYLPKTTFVSLTIIDFIGNKIKTIVSEEKYAGKYIVIWDGTNDKNEKVSSSVYFYKLETNENKIVRKMILLK